MFSSSKIARGIGVGLLLAAGLVTVYFTGGSRLPQGEIPSLSSDLEMRVNSGDASIDFATLFPGVWTQMHVFAPYTTEARVTKALGKPWPQFDATDIDMSDSFFLVVFERNGDVYGWYRQQRVVDIESLSKYGPIAREDALFDVVRSADGSSWRLVPPAR